MPGAAGWMDRVGSVPAPDLLSPPETEWTVRAEPLADVLADLDPHELVLALPVPAGGLSAEGSSADALALLGLDAKDVQAAHEPAGEAGSLTRLPLVPGERAARLVLLVGVGAGSTPDLRAAGAALGRAVRGRAALVATLAAGVTDGAQD